MPSCPLKNAGYGWLRRVLKARDSDAEVGVGVHGDAWPRRSGRVLLRVELFPDIGDLLTGVIEVGTCGGQRRDEIGVAWSILIGLPTTNQLAKQALKVGVHTSNCISGPIGSRSHICLISQTPATYPHLRRAPRRRVRTDVNLHGSEASTAVRLTYSDELPEISSEMGSVLGVGVGFVSQVADTFRVWILGIERAGATGGRDSAWWTLTRI